MRKPRWLTFVAILAVFALVGAACGDDGPGGGGGGGDGGGEERLDVTVYGQGAWTGDFNYLVIPSFQAAQLRFDELNEEEGYPANITFEQADTQGNPEQVPTVVEDVTGNEDTVAVLGPNFSGESEAAGPTYEENGIPFVTPSATNPGLADQNWEYWYRACGNDASQGQFAADFVVQELAPEALFVAHDKSTYGQGLAEVVRDAATEADVNQVGFSGIETGQDDYSAFISDVEASGADVLFFGGYDADFGKIVAQASDAGLDIDMMSGDGSVSSTFLDLAGDAAEGVYLIAPTNLGGEFIEKYNQEVGGDASSVPVYAAEGYDVASLLGEGIRAAIEGGAESPEDIRTGIKEYLDGLSAESPFEGVAKPYAFDPETHEVASAEPEELFYVYQVEGGAMASLGSVAEVLG